MISDILGQSEFFCNFLIFENGFRNDFGVLFEEFGWQIDGIFVDEVLQYVEIMLGLLSIEVGYAESIA